MKTAQTWMMKQAQRVMRTGAAALTVALSAVLFANCSYRTPAIETPVPSEQNVEKSFFMTLEKREVTKDDGGKETREIWVPKDFVCGWASLDEVGYLAQATQIHSVNTSTHCNLQFEITERYLIGRKYDPSRPTERNKWKQAVVIPILSHFYYERARDRQGRDTNEYIENTARSDWSARPMMKLDLSRVTVQTQEDAYAYDVTGMGAVANPVITAVTDVEWDKSRGFLGFNATVTSPVFGALQQGRMRFNFMEFKHNPSFKKTPYHDRNSRHFNALHIMGYRVENVAPVLYAAHWDLSKTHDVYLYGFPEAYVPIAEQVVEKWNDAFEAIGKPRAFKLNKKAMKYPFDLRYPMMVWVEDKEISEFSPLGIGMTQADVRNGEILWGGVVLWGGGIETYVKSYMPGQSVTSAAAARSNPLTPKVLRNEPGYLFSPRAFAPVPESLTQPQLNISSFLAGIPGLTAADANVAASRLQAGLNQVQRRMAMPGAPSEEADLAAMFEFPRANQADVEKLFPGGRLPSRIDRLAREAYQRLHPTANADGRSALVCNDRTFAHVAAGWSMALNGENQRGSQRGKAVEYQDAVKIIVKELIMHEIGHFLGLGHQFKENILPPKGFVPDPYFEKLEAKAKENFTNYTSVMGYRNPVTELDMKLEEVAPGDQDKLVLRYLYNQEFATVEVDNRGRAIGRDFKYLPVPASGEIPDQPEGQNNLRARYFPNCNDFQASFASDPFCNRFDRGYDAETIVKSYFEQMNSNMISRLYAFTDARGGNTEAAEGMLWYHALNTLGRVRLFYDYMRQRYAGVLEPVLNDTKNAYDFARECSDEETGNALLKQIFAQNPELKKLCRVNRMAVQEMTNYLVNPGPDYSEMDYDNSYLSASMTGGDARLDHSRAWGTRKTLTALPLKLVSMNVLTTPYPYFMYGGWMIPVPRFTDPRQGKFVYSSLYPIEFTQAVAATVERNLRFTVNGRGEATTMGRATLSLGHFLAQNFHYSNESTRVHSAVLDSLKKQTHFDIGLVAILLTKVPRQGDPNRSGKFNAEIFDFQSGQKTPVPEGFLLPDGKVIVRGPERTFLYPITRFSFISDDMGYVVAYRLSYGQADDDVLTAHGVKASFEKLHKNILDACIVGQANNGIGTYFTNQEITSGEEGQAADALFEGFEIKKGVANDREKQRAFLDSIRTSFDKYYEVMSRRPNPPRRGVCEESLNGLGLIVSSIGVINGYWLPEVLQYVEK